MPLNRRIVRRKAPSIDSLLHLHPILQKVYSGRQVQSLEAIDYNLRHLFHFQLLQGITQAAERLAQGVMQQQSILILGDFDADGATSTALAVSALRAMGAEQVSYLIPNRFEYGYGLSPEIALIAAKQVPKLLVTVDNGISSYEGVVQAQQAGIDVIITDHHLPPLELPPTTWIVNPNQPGDNFPSKHLAGVGVIFYVMLALRHHLQKVGWFEARGLERPLMKSFLDLVALGTVADMVPLDHNNRILVAQGLQQMRLNPHRPGILALTKVSGCSMENLSASDLGFLLAPRLNAAGRLTEMSEGVACLLAGNEAEALPLAQQLDQLNRERRLIEQAMQKQAFDIVEGLQLAEGAMGICLFNPSWHQGVIGLVAGRVKDRLHQPTIVFAQGGQAGELKGSARSIPGIPIRDVLERIAASNPSLIKQFGGHAMAAGLTLSQIHYKAFAKAFYQEIQEKMLGTCRHELQTDGELSPDDFTITLAELLQAASPWGQGFPEPLFDGRFQVLNQYLVGERHLQMVLTLTNITQPRPLQAIMFNVDTTQWPNQRVRYVEAAYHLSHRSWRGLRSVQLRLETLIACQ